MALRTVTYATLIGAWQDEYNLLANDVGDTSLLDTVATNVVAALNEIHSEVDAIDTLIGELTSLNAAYRDTSIVTSIDAFYDLYIANKTATDGLISTANANIATLNDRTGLITDLTEIIQTNISGTDTLVAAINYVHSVVTGETFEATELSVSGDAVFGGTIGVVGLITANGGLSSTGTVAAAAVTVGGNTVWHVGNDGPGSTLDADTLDGVQGAGYALVSHTHTIANITGLQAALDGKAAVGHTHAAADVVSGTFANARISESSVTQHSAAITPTWTNIESRPTTFTPSAHTHTTADIVSGTFDAARIPSLPYLLLSGGTVTGETIFSGAAPLITFSETDTSASGRLFLTGSIFYVQSSGNVLFTSIGGGNISGVQIRTGNTNWDVWHAGNDGAGSTLDADLLDGQQGAYYLPAGSYTASDVLSKLLTVDGPGSGVDADLLDGQQGAYYLPAGSYTASDVRSKLLTVDGAGSGVDADLLDGIQGSSYARNNGVSNAGNFVTAGESRANLFRFDASLEYFQRSGNSIIARINNAVIGTFNSSGLSVTGSVTASGEVTGFSDIRLKKNLEVIEDPWAILDNISGYTYLWNDRARERTPEITTKRRAGVIYQELAEVFPEALGTSDDEYGSVNYAAMVPVLIEAIKDLKRRIGE